MEDDKPTRVLTWSMSFRRGGTLNSVILVTEEDWSTIQSLSGQDVNLGEVNGKHSEVTYKVNTNDFVVATDKPTEVALFARVLPGGSGFPIMNYLLDRDGGEDE